MRTTCLTVLLHLLFYFFGSAQIDPNSILGFYDTNAGSNESLYVGSYSVSGERIQPDAKITIKIERWNKDFPDYEYKATIDISNLYRNAVLEQSPYDMAVNNSFVNPSFLPKYKRMKKQYRVYFNANGNGVCYYGNTLDANADSSQNFQNTTKRNLNEVAMRVVTNSNKKSGELAGTTKVYFSINQTLWHDNKLGSVDFWAYQYSL